MPRKLRKLKQHIFILNSFLMLDLTDFQNQYINKQQQQIKIRCILAEGKDVEFVPFWAPFR